jgi:hypothetical protein
MWASFLMITGSVSIAACGDDTSAGGAGGTGDTTTTSASTGGTKTSSTTATASSTSSTTGTSSTSGASTTASSSASASSSSTGVMMCGNIVVGSGTDNECDDPGAFALPRRDTVACTPGDDFDPWPLRVFSFPTGEADCVAVRVTNAAGAVDPADMFVFVFDPNGDNALFEDDIDCIAGSGDGLCPAGGLTMVSAGTSYVMVGAYESAGCVAGGSVDYDVAISINGQDLDISAAPLCDSDVNILAP